MNTSGGNENNLLSILKALPRRFLQKLEEALEKEIKDWTPLESVPESIPISDLRK